jgi:hypothetical protein
MATRKADGNPLKNGPATAVAGRIPARSACEVALLSEPVNRRLPLVRYESAAAQELPLPLQDLHECTWRMCEWCIRRRAFLGTPSRSFMLACAMGDAVPMDFEWLSKRKSAFSPY